MNVKITGNASAAEAAKYVEYLENKHGRKLNSLDIHLDGDHADLSYAFAPVEFERIRRITGYLVGTMDHWNNAKAAEEAARVKHDLGCSDCI
ncbi:MAG: anaerobic ribonucleoside-triphosphate reductase [Clostridiales bacterium]|nr:anaerobic ribonucleoside-triphosphate reductase [Clostridiales bacterium]MDY6116534.1 anaerobic ribonucleoside-triphosphate reductase [Anaerovoracaceae bacterium]